MSAIVPTLESERTLPGTLEALLPGVLEGLLGQLVIADGGSSDLTLAIAEEAGADIVRAAPGRGGQLAAGAKKARGDWLLFVHADTRLDPGWVGAVKAFITEEGPETAGYFKLGLDDERRRARVLEGAVALRSSLLALPYGDQGLLVSKALYDEIGGFSPMPLMEDVDIVRRLGRARLRPLACRAITSAARYRRDGYIQRSARNLTCLAGYFAGVSPERLARFYK